MLESKGTSDLAGNVVFTIGAGVRLLVAWFSVVGSEVESENPEVAPKAATA
ncbi:hypothetical protein [Paludisphaera mucosa]|uniref:Uncharacterized protein n=1 Tax=Paludisphaera mucosa TaxID=3030827 RepID=A0ABT6FFK4_9BACT|nr:hypothetical protein [Paludisphaera mucosa]MDG3006175.1 hypothetical protein [Paludisphaera mucosa]